MLQRLLLITLLAALCLPACRNSSPGQEEAADREPATSEILQGKWLRMTQMGPVSMTFTDSATVQADMGDDGAIDVVSRVAFHNDTVTFSDLSGPACPDAGTYKVYTGRHYVSFDPVSDTCNGRVKMTMGFWVRPGFESVLTALNDSLEVTGDPQLRLERARIYMATGMPGKARGDLDLYLQHDSGNARVYINRAGTRFPADMDGVIDDCNRAVSLDPDNKNAYFLRGLALYEKGEKQAACADFQQAIELGFAVLRTAESERCKDFWE